jgi:hypothetical protein
MIKEIVARLKKVKTVCDEVPGTCPFQYATAHNKSLKHIIYRRPAVLFFAVRSFRQTKIKLQCSLFTAG